MAENYLYLPGVTGEFVTAPDSDALDIVGDLDLRIKVALVDWTPGAAMTLVAKWLGFEDNRSFAFEVLTSGTLQFGWTTDGTSGTQSVVQSTAATGVTDGETKWVRATLDVDNDASGHDIKFYTSDNGTDWSQLGTTVTTGGTTSIYAGTWLLEVGAFANGGADPLDGEVYQAQVFDGIDGTVVFDADFTHLTAAELDTGSFTELSSNAATVSLIGNEWAYVRPYNRTDILDSTSPAPELLLMANDGNEGHSPKWADRSGNNHQLELGSAAGADVNDPVFDAANTTVDRDVFVFTTDDFFEIADTADLDFAGGDDFTAIVAFYTTTVAAGSDVLLAKKDDLTTAAGYALVRNAATGQGIVADGTLDDDDTAATILVNTLHTVAMVRNTGDDDIESFLDGVGSGSATTDSTTATLANALPLRIGATSGTAANFFEGGIAAVAIWRSALTDAQVLEAHGRLTRLSHFPPFPRRLSTLVRM